MMNTQAGAFPTEGHDHDDCVATAMAAAEELCRRQGRRFTELRRRVLELVWDSHRPVGAYDLLDRLGAEGRKAAPPTVYRALEFLMDAGLVHRIDSLNAFIGCLDPERSHSGQFLICQECNAVAELHDSDIDAMVDRRASAMGFSASQQRLEVKGVCGSCKEQAQREDAQ